MSESIERRESSVEGGTPASDPELSTLNARPSTSPGRRAWHRFRRNRPAVFSAFFLAAILAAALLYPLFSPHKPQTVSDAQFHPPDRAHWIGTDVHGRDLLVRLCHGAQISVLVGLAGACTSLVIGVLWGAVAGYAGGRIDGTLMRIVDVLYAMPGVILAIVLMATLEPLLRHWLIDIGLSQFASSARLIVLFLALGAVSWLTMARIVRGQVLSLRTRPFVEASRALGAGPAWILRRHIIPNVLGIVIVYLTLTVPTIILYESFLSFLGLGIQPPMASWGSLMAEGVDQINPVRIYWWLIAFPGGLLVLTLLALNFLGDGLRDAWDVRR